MENRKLASIQRIGAVLPIMGADAIEMVTINSWRVVTKKGEFKEGDLCVYFEIDSFLPMEKDFEFLRKSSYKKMGEVMYKNMDKMNQENSNLPESFQEATAYIITGLQSGLHPRDMDINEIILLTNTMGEKWYEQFGYSKEDIPEVAINLDDSKAKK